MINLPHVYNSQWDRECSYQFLLRDQIVLESISYDAEADRIHQEYESGTYEVDLSCTNQSKSMMYANTDGELQGCNFSTRVKVGRRKTCGWGELVVEPGRAPQKQANEREDQRD